MNQMLQEKMGTSVVLKRVCVRCQGLALRYSLLAVEADEVVRYDAVAELDDEKQTVTLGTDIEESLNLFERLWSGSVTPCVLEETFFDMIG